MSGVDLAGAYLAGQLQVLTVPDQAASGGLDLAVPGAYVYQPLVVRYTYVTSAVAADRFPNLRFDDGTVAYGQIFSNATLIANQALGFNFMRGIGEQFGSALAGAFCIPLPEIILPPGHHVRVVSGGFQAGDTIEGFAMLVRRWSTQVAPEQAGGSLVDPTIGEQAFGG